MPHRPFIAAVLLVALAATGTTASAATPTWSVSVLPPPVYRNGDAGAVSCTAAGFCMEVGAYIGSNGLRLPLSQTRIGTTWKLRSTPYAAGSFRAGLGGVSCVSASFCLAVGSADLTGDGSSTPLAEVWDGTSWTITAPLPLPATLTGGSLRSVSCLATVCIAVGDAANASTGVAISEKWDGHAWTMLPTPNADTTILNSISCPSATMCIAVGHHYVGDGFVAVAERWNGASWSVMATPAQTGSFQFNSVSCSSTTVCMAVGFSNSGSGLAELLHATTWKRTTVANTADRLFGVGCRSGVCVAVGNGVGTGTEVWNGTVWVAHSLPPVGRYGGVLWAVSCSTPSACLGVGNRLINRDDAEIGGTTGTLAGAWNGSAWSIVTGPDPGGALDSQLGSVSCPTASLCVAVGSYVGIDAPNPPGVFHPFGEVWRGSSWTYSRITAPANTGLAAIACPSATQCITVGGATGPYAEVWNGTTWAASTMPSLPGSRLTDIACPALSRCIAVGVHGAAGLAMTWNGTTWAKATTPAPASGSIQLYGISCPTTTRCVAVGENLGHGIIETWNGSTWTLTNATHPAMPLNDISCTSLTACVAVGTSVLDTWDGSTWTLQATPTSGLSSISCVSATSCMAVGNSNPYRPQAVTAVLDGGTWTAVDSPAVSRSASGGLTDVACHTGQPCTVVGVAQRAVAMPIAART